MRNQLTTQTNNTQLALQNDSDIQAFRERMQNFVNKLNQLPNSAEIDKTPDGKANSIPISFIEMTLDEYFFGLWDTENFKWSVIANEVVGSIDLTVINPVTNTPIKRVGAACIQIMVDKRPDNVNASQWANNPANKKPNALDMGFPKLKAECVKNAAQSLGKLFGRDINRKKADIFQPLIKPVPIVDRMRALIDDCETIEDMDKYRNQVPPELMEYFNNKYEFINPTTA